MKRILSVAGIALLVLSSTFSAPVQGQQAPPPIWVTGYISSWNVYMYGSSNYGHMPYTAIDFDAMTHVIMFAAGVGADGSVAFNNLKPERRRPLNDYIHSKGKPVILSLGGAGNGSFETCLNSATGRATLLNNLMNIMTTEQYDGFDIDLEPFNSGTYTGLRQFSIDLYNALQARQAYFNPAKKPFLVAAVYNNASSWAALAPYYDQINLMSYDFFGTWFGKSWHNNGVYGAAGDVDISGSPMTTVENKMNKFISSGVPKSKLGVGLAFGGYSWKGGLLSDGSGNGVTAPRQKWSSAPTAFGGELPFWKIKKDYIDPNPANLKFDGICKVPYMGIDNPGNTEDIYVTFEDTTTCREVVKLTKAAGIGGLIIWEVGNGYLGTSAFPSVPVRDELLQAVKSEAFGGTPPPPPSDTTLPAITISNPASGATLTSSPVTVTGTASDNIGVTSVTYSNASNGATGTASGTTSWSFSVALVSGSNTITATARDAAGNAKSSSITVTLSSTPPPPASSDLLIYVESLASGWSNASWNTTPNFASSTPVNTGSLAIKATVSSPWGGLSLRRSSSITNPTSYSAVEFYAHGGSTPESLYVLLENGGSVAGFVQIVAGSTIANSWKMFSIPLSSLNPAGQPFDRIHIQSNIAGDYSVDDYRLVAASGGSGDTTKPSIAISSPANNSSVLSSPVSVSGTASDNVGVTSVTYSNAANGASGTATGTTNWSFSVALAAGSNVITVTARDAAGNTQSASVTVTYSVDTQAPTISVGTVTVSVGGSASDNQTVSSVTWRNAANGATGTATGTTTWSASIPVVSGSNPITFTATDASGNVRTVSITISYATP